MRIHANILTALLLAAGLTACGTQTVKVSIDSTVGEQQVPGKRYVWLSGMAETSPADLHFREFSRYFQTILQQHGYRKSTDGKAPIAIYFSYGVSPGRTTQYTTTTPIYDWVGGDTIVYTETSKDEKGETTSTTRTITTPIRQRLIGMSVGTGQYTVFTRFVTLTAKRYRRGKKPGEMPTLWQTRITSTGPSSDLRALMPVMAAAAAPYIAADTGEVRVVKIKRDDPRVKAFKQRVRNNEK